MGVGIGVGSAIGNEAPTYTRKGGGVGDCEGGWLEHPSGWAPIGPLAPCERAIEPSEAARRAPRRYRSRARALPREALGRA